MAETTNQELNKQPRRAGQKRRPRLRLAAWAIVAAVVVGIILAVHFLAGGKQYSALEVTQTRAMESPLSSSYCELNHNVLRYGTEGAALINRRQETLWEITYQLTAPSVV